MVNPHQSLLGSSNEIETPAEIDGLLNDYFHSEVDLTMASYDDITGELAASQSSLHTSSTSTSARQRILYDDPTSARRTIMRIDDTGYAGTGHEDPHQEGQEVYDDQAEQSMHNTGEELEMQPEEHEQALDRASSVYQQSRRSDQFPLSVSDVETGPSYNNMNEVVARGPVSFYTGDRASHDQGEDFKVYEDLEEGTDAQAYVPASCRYLFVRALTRCCLAGIRMCTNQRQL